MEYLYYIVNEETGRPVHAIAFCACYTDKEVAEAAAEQWNKHSRPEGPGPGVCRVKVVCKEA
jgi:hypothetical protein